MQSLVHVYYVLILLFIPGYELSNDQECYGILKPFEMIVIY
jgi:hypothetical protein